MESSAPLFGVPILPTTAYCCPLTPTLVIRGGKMAAFQVFGRWLDGDPRSNLYDLSDVAERASVGYLVMSCLK